MDNAAAIPVTVPVRAISLALPRAKVRPASAPVNSTRASLSPRIIAPV